MEPQNNYVIYENQYQNNLPSKYSRAFFKDRAVIQYNNNQSNYSLGNNSFNRKIIDSSQIPVNNPSNAAKIKKFNSFSANIKYNSRFNTQNNQNNGFYVTPIINGNKKLIAIKVPDTAQNIELNKDNYHVENFTFQVSPKKYTYKPYKQPKRKHNNLMFINSQKNYGYYCSNSSSKNYKKKY